MTSQRPAEEWRQLFDLAPDPYLLTDRIGLIVEVNRRAATLFGLPRRSHRALVLRFAANCRAEIQRAVRDPEGHPDPIPVRLIDDDKFRGELRCVPIGAERLLWLLRDVSETVRTHELLLAAVDRDRLAADRLRAVDSMRRAFLLAASHDLRGPLATIVALSSLLTESELSAEQMALTVDRIQRTAGETLSLLDNLLDYERIDATDAQPRLQSVDLGPIVERAARSVPMDDHRLELDIGPAPGEVDIALVERIVGNLVNNGIQHTPPGSTIWVRCSAQPDGLLLVVEDDGPGIAPDKRNTIFDLFQRGDQAHGGLGVGLALVRRFAELHGGYARVEDRLGGGSSFQVLLGRPTAAPAERS